MMPEIIKGKISGCQSFDIELIKEVSGAKCVLLQGCFNMVVDAVFEQSDRSEIIGQDVIRA